MKENTLPIKIEVKSLYELWQNEPEVLKIYDFRSLDKFKLSHIPGSEWAQIEDFEKILEVQDQNQLIVVLCDHEDSAVCTIKDENLENVMLLSGGLQSWTKQKYPTSPS